MFPAFPAIALQDVEPEEEPDLSFSQLHPHLRQGGEYAQGSTIVAHKGQSRAQKLRTSAAAQHAGAPHSPPPHHPQQPQQASLRRHPLRQLTVTRDAAAVARAASPALM